MKAINLKNYKKAVEEAAKTIKAGGLVVFPSDSVYGLAVDPTNQAAVKKLLAFKKRWTGKAISIAVADEAMAKRFVKINKNSKNIYKNLLPGPFTVVSPGKHKVAAGIEAEDGSLGIRIPDYRFITDLVKKLNSPITATSANLSGRRPHYSLSSFVKTLSKKRLMMIDVLVDGGKLPRNKPSTVIDATEDQVKILRKGDLVAGDAKILISKSEKETEKIAEFLLRRNPPQPPFDKGRALVFGLSGDLGTGKTVFSGGIGKALGIKERIKSPTFVIYNEYKINPKFEILNSKQTKKSKVQNNKTFLHFDLYRISKDFELEEIDFFWEVSRAEVVCIEWPEKLGRKNLLRLKRKTNLKLLSFEYVDSKTRKISF